LIFDIGRIEALGNTGARYSDEAKTQWSSNFASRNPDLIKAIMITSGGLSGGISSTIAGGNFWAGARQGIITSGLNHVGHYVANSLMTSKYPTYTKEELRNRINAKYGGERAADERYAGYTLITNDDLEAFANAVLPELMEAATTSAAGKPTFKIVNGIEGGEAGKVDYDLIHGTDIIPKGPIEIYMDRLAKGGYSLLGAAYVIGHELIHRIDMVSGYCSLLYMRGVLNWNDYTEVNAYQWEIKSGNNTQLNIDMHGAYQNKIK